MTERNPFPRKIIGLEAGNVCNSPVSRFSVYSLVYPSRSYVSAASVRSHTSLTERGISASVLDCNVRARARSFSFSFSWDRETREYVSEENRTEVFALLISAGCTRRDRCANNAEKGERAGSLSFASRLISELSRLSYL